MKFRLPLFILSLFLFLSFIFFSYLVAREKFTQIDFDTTVKLQDKLPRKLDLPFSILSVIGTAEVTGVIWLILFLYLLIKRFWYTGLSLLLLPIALAFEVFGKLFVLHPGPPYLFYRGVIHFELPSHFVPVDYSYPSGHLLRTAFLVTFLVIFFSLRLSSKKKLFINFGLLIFFGLMFLSRIYLGEHWLSDVVGGSLLGISFGILSGLSLPLKKVSSA